MWKYFRKDFEWMLIGRNIELKIVVRNIEWSIVLDIDHLDYWNGFWLEVGGMINEFGLKIEFLMIERFNKNDITTYWVLR